MSDVPVFNRKQLLSSCGDDEELAGQVVEIFMLDTPKQFADLELAMASGETKTAERIAHSIKGASATVGGESLRSLAFEFEMAAHDGSIAPMVTRMDDLKARFTKLKQALETAGYGNA